ncbi:hypothetical protein ACFFX0_27530 [Citricoccus parietis]|uniref:Uncharacterized protein n=1 Tax=Citricoccus parietis TaxID=592307 RepID=A0ABV5G741_9MICC
MPGGADRTEQITGRRRPKLGAALPRKVDTTHARRVWIWRRASFSGARGVSDADRGAGGLRLYG